MLFLSAGHWANQQETPPRIALKSVGLTEQTHYIYQRLDIARRGRYDRPACGVPGSKLANKYLPHLIASTWETFLSHGYQQGVTL